MYRMNFYFNLWDWLVSFFLIYQIGLSGALEISFQHFIIWGPHCRFIFLLQILNLIFFFIYYLSTYYLYYLCVIRFLWQLFYFTCTPWQTLKGTLFFCYPVLHVLCRAFLLHLTCDQHFHFNLLRLRLIPSGIGKLSRIWLSCLGSFGYPV